ncbi:triphosphoribosyl-dephospho-CoA synthase [Halovenus carboxidivorans]|uniref:triphosphoribosyl-dephospho-CoA synthase n=1 Tax=Halovenus carboxidivorans TaxID=2692199 RepID=UPI0034A552D0
MRSIADNAQLALLLEVSSTPKPGNVDREHEYADLRFEHFVTGAVGAREGLERAAEGGPVGAAFERAIAGMSRQSGGNTQFGAILLLTPLVVAAARTRAETGARTVTPEAAGEVVSETTVDDAVGFYRAFEHVSVAVDEPPEELAAPDVRRGAAAEPALREAGLTLEDVMADSAEIDGLAAEFVGGFERTFETARRIRDRDGPVTDRAARVFLELLAEEIDTFVVTQHDRETAREVKRRAAAALDGEETPEDLAAEFVDRGINPGTTADLIAGGFFVALERGLEV